MNVQTVCKQKPVDYLFELCEANVSKLFDLMQPLSQHLFSKRKKEKKKKESTSIEVMMNENGGSIPTGSEECTLHSLYFYLDVLSLLNENNTPEHRRNLCSATK